MKTSERFVKLVERILQVSPLPNDDSVACVDCAMRIPFPPLQDDLINIAYDFVAVFSGERPVGILPEFMLDIVEGYLGCERPSTMTRLLINCFEACKDNVIFYDSTGGAYVVKNDEPRVVGDSVFVRIERKDDYLS